jgi:hypothetical protein
MGSRRHINRPAASAVRAATVVAILCSSALAGAQPTEQRGEPVLTTELKRRPITPEERRDWFVRSVAGPKSVTVAVVSGAWQTATDSPKEWNGNSGFAKRVLAHEAHAGISKGIEGSLGTFWGEDPRRARSGRATVSGRIGFALKTVVLAPRQDGHLAPAWGRYAGAVGSSVVENAWLPARLSTPRETARRIASSFVSRVVVNLLTEFGPDLRRGLRAVGSGRGSRKHPVEPRGAEPVAADSSTKF